MCKRDFYAIFDGTPKVIAIANSYKELNEIITGMGLDKQNYVCPVIDRREARKLRRELSDRAKPLPNASVN